MDDIDFEAVDEVILVVDGEHLIFRNRKSFARLGKHLQSVGAPRRPPAKRPKRRVILDEPEEEPDDEPEEPEEGDFYGEEDDYEPEEAPPPRPSKARSKAKTKRSGMIRPADRSTPVGMTAVPGGKSKINLKVNIPSGNIKDAAEKLKAQARASYKGKAFQD